MYKYGLSNILDYAPVFKVPLLVISEVLSMSSISFGKEHMLLAFVFCKRFGLSSEAQN